MHQISVWFVCKLCRSSYQQVPDLIKHKFENHFEQFKSVKHIIFEESIYDADFDFPNGDHFTQSKPFDQGQVDWDPCVNTIQKQPFSPNNISCFKPEYALFEDKKPFTYSSANSDPPDTIDSRSPYFRIEQNSVIINEETLNDLDSAAPNLREKTRSYHVIDENKLCNSAWIKNPFVLLKRLSLTEIESAKSNNENSQLIQNDFDFAPDTYPINPMYSEFDQPSINSDINARPRSDCEIDADLDVKPFKLKEESLALSEQNQLACLRQNRKRVFQEENNLTTHYYVADLDTLLSNDEMHGDALALAVTQADWIMMETKTNDTNYLEKNQLSLQTDTIQIQNDCKINVFNRNALSLQKRREVSKQAQFCCPHQECKEIFKWKSCLTRHLESHHRVNDLKRRWLMAAGRCPPTHEMNNDYIVDYGNTPSVALLKTKTSETFDSEKHKLSRKIYTVTHDVLPKSLEHNEVDSTITIGKQPQFTCPRGKCKLIFSNITSLSRHVNYYHGQDDLEQKRRPITSAIPQSGTSDDKEVDVRDIPESPLAQWIKKEAETCNRNGNPNVIRLDPDPTTINRDAVPISQRNPIKCKLCSKSFKSELSVKSHVSTCWFDNKQKHRYCVPCGFTFGTPDRLKRHNFSKHFSIEDKLARAKYMCDHCPQIFYQESEFTTHVCEIGGFPCKSMGILGTHIATTHSNHKTTFKCPYTHCGIALKNRMGRDTHLRVVHSE